MKRHFIVPVMFLLTAFVSPVYAKGLAPEKGWRIYLKGHQIRAKSPGFANIRGLFKGVAGKEYTGAGQGPIILHLDLPWVKKSDLLIVAEMMARVKSVPVQLMSSRKAGKNYQSVEKIDVPSRPGKHPRVGHLTVPRGKNRYIRVVLGREGERSPRLVRLRIFKLDKRGNNDYWLFLGASLTTAGCKPDDFHDIIGKNHPGYDPYIANEAVSGWACRHLLKALPGFLKKHRHARYVTIHMGGNNVSSSRPYPGAAKKIAAELEQILRMIIKAGKIPILSRLSYRAYKAKKTKPAVPPESNGSGPYVVNIYDPLIREYCAPFYDKKNKRGHVDFYNYYKKNADQIGGDGIHLRPVGYKNMNRLWAEIAGGIVYSGQVRR
jgi:lysophospholipase L1-like esterase